MIFAMDGICLNRFDCTFVHEEVKYTNKTGTKDGLQYTNKKLSLSSNIVISWDFMIIYRPQDLVMK